jgi:hypothetical protein
MADAFLPNANNAGINVELCTIEDIVKYFGVTLNTRKLTKINSTNIETKKHRNY